MNTKPPKHQPTDPGEVPEGAESVRLEDVLTFLDVYEKATTAKLEDRANFSKLLSHGEEKKGLTTRIGQLRRVVDFLYGKGKEDEGPRLHLLFEEDNLGGLVPSADAHRLRKNFVALRDAYWRIKEEIYIDRFMDSPPVLRLGASQTIGMRLLSSLFSDLQRVFPDGIDLKIEIANSHDLIRRLKLRLLDVVISYGHSEAKSETFDPETNLTFRSLGYPSRMVLLCHPTANLWVRTEKDDKPVDANRGYWDDKFWNRSRKEIPAYHRLKPINLENVEFKNLPLIVVPSWHQPKALADLARRLPSVRVLRVPWYDEALALVRMGMGMAVTSEVFSKRARVTAFRLEPKEEFERWIGAYFHPPEDRLPPHVQHLLRVIEAYLSFCRVEIRDGDPPAFGNQKYIEFCNSLAKKQS